MFVTSSGFLTVSQLIATIASIRYVVPSDLGLWHSSRLLQTYSTLLLAGVVNGLSRELPFFLGRNDSDTARRFAATTQFCAHVASGFSLFAAALWIICVMDGDRRSVLTACTVAIVVSSTFQQLYLIVTFRSNKAFARLAAAQYTQAIIAIVSLLLVVYFGYAGFLIRTMIVSLLSIGFLWYLCPLRVAPRFSVEDFKVLMKIGMPIFGLDYLKNVASTMDRVALLRYGGTESVGHYSLAATVSQTISSLPKAIGQYIYPQMTFAFGKGEQPLLLWRRAVKGALAGVTISAFIALIGVFLLEPVVDFLAPAYAPGIPAAQLTLFAAIFGCTTIMANVMWSMKQWRLMTMFQVGSALLYAAGPFMFLWSSSNILTATALGILMSSILRAVLAVALSYYATHQLAQSKQAEG